MSVRCSRAAPPWSWSTGSSRSRSPRSSQRRQGAVAQELERARARLHVLAAVAGADLRETAAPLQIAPIVDGARCIEEDHTAAWPCTGSRERTVEPRAWGRDDGR